MTTPARASSSGSAAKAAKRLPSRPSSTSSSCETAAPEIGATGGEESWSKHTADGPYLFGACSHRATVLDEIAAANEEEPERGAGERQDRGDEQKLVQAGDEGALRGVRNCAAGARRRLRDRLLRRSRGDLVRDLRDGDPVDAAQRVLDVTRHPGLEDRAEPGDPGRDPDLPERVADPRRHTAHPGIDDADGGGGQRRVHHSDPDAGDDEAGEEGGPSRRLG